MHEPTALAALAERLAGYRAAFESGADFSYGIFDRDDQVVGGAGIHRRGATEVLEIGYWLRADRVGRGLMTEAVEALTRVAFETLGAERVEIRCDPHNERSHAVPRRLGYRLRETLHANALTPTALPRDTMVWERQRPA